MIIFTGVKAYVIDLIIELDIVCFNAAIVGSRTGYGKHTGVGVMYVLHALLLLSTVFSSPTWLQPVCMKSSFLFILFCLNMFYIIEFLFYFGVIWTCTLFDVLVYRPCFFFYRSLYFFFGYNFFKRVFCSFVWLVHTQVYISLLFLKVYNNLLCNLWIMFCMVLVW